MSKPGLSSAAITGISGILAGIVANVLLLVPGAGTGAIAGGAIGFIVSFLALGMAKKSGASDMKFVIPGIALNLVALGLGIYARYFWLNDQAPPDPDLLFLDSLQ